MNRRRLLKGVGAGGLLALGVSTSSAESTTTNDRGSSHALVVGADGRSDVEIQDHCIVDCCEACPDGCGVCRCDRQCFPEKK